MAVGGCWAQSQKEAGVPSSSRSWTSPSGRARSRLGELVARERLDAVGAFSFDGAFSGSLPAVRERPHQAWVQISVGCNCVCAYCIVPSVRGASAAARPGTWWPRSRRWPRRRARGDAPGPERQLLRPRPAARGRVTFAELLRGVAAVDGIRRVRYTSPHPKDMRADVIAAMAECPEVCEHLHLPAQSGSTRVLKAMRRTYGRERYLDLVARLREAIPDLSLTTDLIVGFPGRRRRTSHRPCRSSRSAATTAPTPSSTRRGRAPRPTRPCPTTSRPRSSASASAASSRWSSAPRRSGPRGSSAAPGRCWWRARPAPTLAPARAAAPEHRRELHRHGRAGDRGVGADRGRHLHHPERQRGRRRGAEVAVPA